MLNHLHFPSVNAALETARKTHMKNAFGKMHQYYRPSDEDLEVARKFDVKKALEEAVRQRSSIE